MKKKKKINFSRNVADDQGSAAARQSQKSLKFKALELCLKEGVSHLGQV